MIVLPESLESELSPAELRDLLTHEVAHIANGDLWTGLFQRVASIAFWFHPLVHWMNREIAHLREEICDTHVLRASESPRGYVHCLLRIAESVALPRSAPSTLGLFSSRGSFESRVDSILKEDRDMTTEMNRPARASLVVLMLLLLVALPGVRLASADPPRDAGEIASAEPPREGGEEEEVEPPADPSAALSSTPNGVRESILRASGRAPRTSAGPSGPSTARDPRVDAAVVRGVDWLLAMQSTAGAWEWREVGAAGSGHLDPGLTGLAVLALVHSGNGDMDTLLATRRAVGWLVKQQDAEGFIGKRDSLAFMYGHLIGSHAIFEAYRRLDDPSLREPAERALGAILKARNPYRAWRYGVRDGDNDTSVTGWAVLALDAAARAGLDVSEPISTQVLDFFDEVTDPESGHVGYTSRKRMKVDMVGKNEEFADHPTTTAIGVVARSLYARRGDRAQASIAARGRALLDADLPRWVDGAVVEPIDASRVQGSEAEGGRYFVVKDDPIDFYYWHWGSLALALDPGGDAWRRWWLMVREELVTHQETDGSWEPVGRWAVVGGRVYATAINLLTLETRTRADLIR